MENSSKSKKCCNCGASVEYLGLRKIRFGGTTGGWKIVLGHWAELGEDMIELELWLCSGCRRVDFYLPQNR